MENRQRDKQNVVDDSIIHFATAFCHSRLLASHSWRIANRRLFGTIIAIAADQSTKLTCNDNY